MSARALRKVLKGKEAAQVPETTQQHLDSDDEESDSPSPSSLSSKNLFDLLDQENGSDTNDLSSVSNSEESMLSSTNGVVTKVASTNYNLKKKTKKKIKDRPSSRTKQVGNALDAMMENLSLGNDSSVTEVWPSKTKPALVSIEGNLMKGCPSSILQTDPKFLRPENELRRIFGSKVVSSFERTHQVGSSRQSRGARRARYYHRKTILVSPPDHWPQWKKGFLDMDFLENRDGYDYFQYVYSSTYDQAQRNFEAAKDAHDLNNIANVLLNHPYHIDSLITLAEYFDFSGEHQMSADAISKCLFALECAWHPMFNPLQGNCRLKYSTESNKPLFSTLFTHMKHLDRRGCHRSALEICKLLLSLDSDDPMGALFCIDYFSLRAQEFEWLERFSEEYKSDNSLWLYPNFSYSLAICRFYLEHEESRKERKMEGGKATSSDLMKQALMLHPSVLGKLVTKVPLKERIWTKILEHSFFRSEHTGSLSLDHLINIYIERSYIIWRLPDLHNFLKETALLVIEELENCKRDARDWVCVRKEAFASDKNEYSHLLVSNFSDSVPMRPPENLQDFMIDPRVIEMQNAENNNRVAARAPRDVENRNPLAVLLESILPWNDYGRREDDDQDDHGHIRVHDN